MPRGSAAHELKKWEARKNGELFISPHLLRSREDMESHLEMFRKNMLYLLDQRGMSQKDLELWFKTILDPFDSNPVPKTSNPPWAPNLYNLIAVANFFDRNIGQMLCTDIEIFDEMTK